MRRPVRFLLLVPALGALIVACNKTPPAPPAPSEAKASGSPVVQLTPEGVRNAEVRWQHVEPGAFTPRLRLAGSITGDPKHIAEIGARVPGRVTAVTVALGDRVRKGQVLLEVEAVELHDATLNYLTASAKVRAARDTLARQKQLVDERVGAVQDLRRAEAEAASAEAAFGEAREHLGFLGLSPSEIAGLTASGNGGGTRSRVRSPIDGRVATLNVSMGQVLTGNENVVTVADVNEVWAQLRVYEGDLADVRVGASADVQVPTYADRTFVGTINFVSDVLDPVSRSADVRATLSNAEGALRPGMSATAMVVRPQAMPGLWLPAEAIQTHDGATIAFVRVGEGRFEARSISVGREQGGSFNASRGIAPADDVVVHGAFALRAELERSALEE